MVAKKPKECSSCNDLTARLERLEQRLDRAEEDAAHWKKRWEVVDEECRQLRGKISLLEHENAELRAKLEAKEAQLTHLQKLMFGEKSEATESVEVPALDTSAVEKRNKGKQPGSKGYGRKIRAELPVEVVEHDVPAGEKCCLKCGADRVRSAFTEDSEEITYRMQLVRLCHKRLKYKRSCKCALTPEFVTAPLPPKVIPKGLFTTEFWSFAIVEKFLLQRPMSRICYSLGLEGLDVSSGTMTGGLKKLTKLFAPLYNAIRAQVRSHAHWQMDETHWRVYVDEIGKENHKWWLWIAETKSATLFLLDPSRSAKVPKALLKNIPAGILSCDRYSAYKALDEGIQLAYCWAHVRRDFIQLRDGYPKLAPLAQSWLERINDAFHNNNLRLSSSADSAAADANLRVITKKMIDDAAAIVESGKHAEPALAVFRSLIKHWPGLSLFVELPNIPMDNNASERGLRNAVVGRKNYYGSRSIWSGYLSAMLFSLFATLKKHDVDPRKYLTEYLQACALNGGRPPQDLKPFLPWDFDADRSRELSIGRERLPTVH